MICTYHKSLKALQLYFQTLCTSMNNITFTAFEAHIEGADKTFFWKEYLFSMYIYNVTTQVIWAIHDEWVRWMKEFQIPEVVATGCFTHHRMVRVLEIDETEGPTYAVQFFTENLKSYKHYMQDFAPKLRQNAIKQWAGGAITYHSIMEVVH